MKSGVPWHVKGVGRQARQTAHESARRSGMSVGEWLDTVIIDSTLSEDVEPEPSVRGDHAPDRHAAPEADPRSAHPGHEDRQPDPDRFAVRDRDARDARSAQYRHEEPEPDSDRFGARDREARFARYRHFPDRFAVRDRDARSPRHGHEDPHPDPDRFAVRDRDARSARHGREDPHPDPDRFAVRDRDARSARHGHEDPHPDPDRFAAWDRSARPPRQGHEEQYHDRDQGVGSNGHQYVRRDDRRHPAETAECRAHPEYTPSADRVARTEPVAEQNFTALNQRLDTLTQQIDRLARLNAANAANAANAQNARAASRDEDAARQLAAVIAKIENRLDRLAVEGRNARHEIERRVAAVDRAVASLDREPPRPTISAAEAPAISAAEAPAISAAEVPTALDQALSEIAERQRALDHHAPGLAVEPLPRARTQEFAALERELRHINQEMATLKMPCGIDKAVDTLRDDLAEIGLMVQEAMPRKAVEALEAEVRKLSERVESTRHAGADGAALAGLERGLAEVRDALHALTPAENLVGFNEAVNTLSQKIDLLAGDGQDPTALKQLEGAILAMRGIVSHVASNDALTMLSEEVRSLTAKVEQAAHAGGGDMISSLEHRIGTLADALEARNRGGHEVEFEAAVQRLIDKIERIQVTHGDPAAVGQLEQRIATLVDKLDASDSRLNHLEGIQHGLAELLNYLERQHSQDIARSSAEMPPEVGALQRDLADLKQIDRQTQDTLEAVHGALGHVVDRLAMIETDMREKSARAEASNQVPTAQAPWAASGAFAPPAAAAAPPPPATAASDPAKPAPAEPQPAAAAFLPPATREPFEAAAAPPQPNPAPPPVAERRPIDPNLPPDHPLEPGSAARGRSGGSPADRIAASEAALGPAKPPVIPDPGGKSNFIAAARRAAQAAARDAPPRAVLPKDAAAGPAKTGGLADLLAKHRRSLVVGASVIVIVAGMLHMLVNWLGSPGGETTGRPASETAVSTPGAAAPHKAPAPPAENPAPPAENKAPAPPSKATDRQSNLVPNTGSTPVPPSGSPAPVEAAPPTLTAPKPLGTADVTGSIQPPAKPQPPNPAPAAADSPVTAAVMPPPRPHVPAAPIQPAPAAPAGDAEKLPASFGPALRNAAIKGDPAAEYEIAVRFADGRGVPQKLAEAVHWFERAAQHGLAPAQFRLGGLYEKGLGVKKNPEAARRLYLAAGEAGNAKALHNLAVLYAEGIDGKPDYQTAAKWFRKAAGYGVTDSQYNLGILYARGIGVEHNLTEAYRWFALAARNGDHEALKKRDDLEKRLDRASLAAAKGAVETFRPEPQPEAAIEVKAPPGGWDAPVAAAGHKRKLPIAKPKLDLSTPPAGR
jgi:localization factor PodJL